MKYHVEEVTRISGDDSVLKRGIKLLKSGHESSMATNISGLLCFQMHQSQHRILIQI